MELGVAVVAGDPDAGYVTDETFVLDENLCRPVTGGFGPGEDARNVCREAIKWWGVAFSCLEAELNV